MVQSWELGPHVLCLFVWRLFSVLEDRVAKAMAKAKSRLKADPKVLLDGFRNDVGPARISESLPKENTFTYFNWWPLRGA